MADLNPRQFGDWEYFGSRNPWTGDVDVTAMEAGGGKQVGAMAVHGDIHHAEQAKINRKESPWSRGHETKEEPSGQLRWSGGHMNPSKPHLGWAGVLSEHRDAKLMEGLLGVTTHLHGGMPMGDRMLSEEGSRFQKRLVETYGMRPHPENPEMKPNWHPVPDYASEAEIQENTNPDYWEEEDDDYEPDWSYDYDEPRDLTEDERMKWTDTVVSHQNAIIGMRSLEQEGFNGPGAFAPEKRGISVNQTVQGLRTLKSAKPSRSPHQQGKLF